MRPPACDMNSRQVRKLKRIFRALSWPDKMETMDWVNSWYSSYKEEIALDGEQ
jgi:hypothetical protein